MKNENAINRAKEILSEKCLKMSAESMTYQLFQIGLVNELNGILLGLDFPQLRITVLPITPKQEQFIIDRLMGQKPKPEMVECDQCDGCGWYEGGPTLKTTCQTCKGTGEVLKVKKQQMQSVVTSCKPVDCCQFCGYLVEEYDMIKDSDNGIKCAHMECAIEHKNKTAKNSAPKTLTVGELIKQLRRHPNKTPVLIAEYPNSMLKVIDGDVKLHYSESMIYLMSGSKIMPSIAQEAVPRTRRVNKRIRTTDSNEAREANDGPGDKGATGASDAIRGCKTCDESGEIEDNGPKACPSCGGNGYIENT
jgi:hypothetical protein